MTQLINSIESISKFVGKAVSWCTLLLVILICLDVAMRYLFDYTVIWVIEIEIYLFAMIFLGGAAYTFQQDEHVRVDVFYDKLSPKRKAIVNIFGGVLFLIPWTWVIINVGFHYARMSFEINESSAQAGGLPMLFILKSFIMIGFFFLLLQAVASILKAIQILRS